MTSSSGYPSDSCRTIPRTNLLYSTNVLLTCPYFLFVLIRVFCWFSRKLPDPLPLGALFLRYSQHYTHLQAPEYFAFFPCAPHSVGQPTILRGRLGFPRISHHARVLPRLNPHPSLANGYQPHVQSDANDYVPPSSHAITGDTMPAAHLIRDHQKVPRSGSRHLRRLFPQSNPASQALKYSFHFSIRSDSCRTTMRHNFDISCPLNPPLRSKRIGFIQNFATQSSRSIWTCGGSPQSLA